MARFSITWIVSSLFGVSLAVNAGQGYFVATSLADIDANVRQLVEKRTPSLVALGQLNAEIGAAGVAQSALLFGDPKQAARSETELRAALDGIETAKSRYKPLMVDEGDRATFAAFVAARWAVPAERKSLEEVAKPLSAA